MVFNATFNNISVISWQSVLLMEETGVSGENHQPASSHWQTQLKTSFELVFVTTNIKISYISWRKPEYFDIKIVIWRKSLINFITYSCMEYTLSQVRIVITTLLTLHYLTIDDHLVSPSNCFFFIVGNTRSCANFFFFHKHVPSKFGLELSYHTICNKNIWFVAYFIYKLKKQHI
jgi:hypothetical protein